MRRGYLCRSLCQEKNLNNRHPIVVRFWRLRHERRTIGKTSAAEPARAEMFEASRGAEHFIAPAVERRDAICQIYDCGPVVVIGRTGIEEIVVHIRGHHE